MDLNARSKQFWSKTSQALTLKTFISYVHFCFLNDYLHVRSYFLERKGFLTMKWNQSNFCLLLVVQIDEF